MSARALNRLRTLGRAALSIRPASRTRPEHPRRILVLHELLLGDTLMLAPLLARLRARYPHATIYVAARPAILPLFSGRPYGAIGIPFDERAPGALAGLEIARDCDLAIVPGENRYTVTARAAIQRAPTARAGRTGARTSWSSSPATRPAWRRSSRRWRAPGHPTRATGPATGRRPRISFFRSRRAPTRCSTSAPAHRSSIGLPIAGRRSPGAFRLDTSQSGAAGRGNPH